MLETDYLLKDKIKEILFSFFEQEIKTLIDENISFDLNVLKLIHVDSQLGNLFLHKPEKIILFIKELLLEHKNNINQRNSIQNGFLKENFSIKITNIPIIEGIVIKEVPSVKDIGNLVSFKGTVVRTGITKIISQQSKYLCRNCGEKTIVEADDTRYGLMEAPIVCNKFVGIRRCGATNMLPIDDSTTPQGCCDYQEIKIQEMAGVLQTGKIPRSIVIVLKNEFVDRCTAGNTVTVTGIVKARWRKGWSSKTTQTELVLIAYDLCVSSDMLGENKEKDCVHFFKKFREKYKKTPYKARDIIVSSVCPDISGLHLVKLSVLLTLIGGVSYKEALDSTTTRGEGHLLLIGDPGTAKSRLLSFSSKLIIRSVLTTGHGSTTAGLTAAAVKDGNEWQLEAGALVLSDLGICCIDEFTSIRPADRTAIHEAMEQQTLSIAKAGIIAKLRTRCSIIAACNIDERTDDGGIKHVSANINSPLLSRFDLIIPIEDKHDEDFDFKTAEFILERMMKKETKHISLERLRSYISYVKISFCPQIGEEASFVLKRYYQRQREAGNVTVRLFEGLIRLSQAHARLMFRHRVTIDDAVQAVILMETSITTENILDLFYDIQEDSPADSDTSVFDIKKKVLSALGLDDLFEQTCFDEEESNTDNISFSISDEDFDLFES